MIPVYAAIIACLISFTTGVIVGHSFKSGGHV